MRHARAQVGGDQTPDSLRALTAEGRREAADVGTWLAGRSAPPTLVLCSSATRTVETMEQVVAALPEKPVTRVSEDLYLASAWKLFELVRATDAGVASLLLVAHNPGMSELASRLSAQGDPAALRSLSRRFPPATLAEVELPGSSFAEVEPDGGTLISHFVA